MKELILGCWLGIQAGVDFKYKEIPVWLSIAGGVIGIVFCIIEKRFFAEVILACLPGVLAFFFSWVSREAMGYGDGMTLVVMGLYLPIRQLLSVSLLAFWAAGVVAFVLLIIFRKNGNYRIPFIPFLGLAYALEWIVRKGGW